LVLLPNLHKAAEIIAIHQEWGSGAGEWRVGVARGSIALGDPQQKLVFLIAPLIAAGLWAGNATRVTAFELDPALIVAVFLDGHRGSA